MLITMPIPAHYYYYYEIVVFGHSFVSRLRTHAVQGMGESNLRLDAGEFRVFMYGVSD